MGKNRIGMQPYLLGEITKLTEQWYALVGRDHHKDGDCHWRIETRWSYGEAPTYSLNHHGYLLDEIHENYSSYSAALRGLRDLLVEAIAAETANGGTRDITSSDTNTIHQEKQTWQA